jgi:nucleotide-binding universal stress UspA family protein
MDMSSRPLTSRHPSVLVYYDGSTEALLALERLALLASLRRATIHVLAVADMTTAIVSTAGALTDAACSDMISAAWRLLDDALARLRANGIRACGDVAHGRVPECIARQAALVDADVIVIGYRHRHGWRRWFGARPLHLELLEGAGGRTVMAVPAV